jgi:hypothetical protein
MRLRRADNIIELSLGPIGQMNRIGGCARAFLDQRDGACIELRRAQCAGLRKLAACRPAQRAQEVDIAVSTRMTPIRTLVNHLRLDHAAASPGKRAVKTEPLPSSLVTVTSPHHARELARESRPSPVRPFILTASLPAQSRAARAAQLATTAA